ncbi:coiled-coil domain-containing protein AGAP005037 isoform X1 [Temnothorax nylanderi]|uniref:coiled-coil domain-containing protein AGAP005037 isoform X1 n=1 Tax=Temnothorax nylanderi TaxID=102681 RepID=UPI003A87622D
MCSKCSECCQGSRHSVDASPTPGSDSDISEEEWNPDGKGRQSNDTGGSVRGEVEPGSNELTPGRRSGGGGGIGGGGGGGVLGVGAGGGGGGGGSGGRSSSGGRSRDEPRRHTLGGDHQPSLHHQQFNAAQQLHPLHPHHLPPPHGQYGNPPSRHTTMDLEMGTKSRQRKSPLPRGYPPPSSTMLFDDDPGIMSEVETSSTGFRRGGKQRSSLPVVRTPSKTLERPLGLVFLQYRNETKRALLPNEITSIDTVKALFVRSFPKQLTMEYLDSPHVKVYIHDSNKDMFYELEDLRSHLRDIRDRSVLRLFESADGVTGMPGPLGVPGGGGGLPPHWEDQSYFSEPEFDSEYQHQHIHKSKTAKNSTSGSGYYVGGSSTLPRGGSLLRAYSPAASSVVGGPSATPTQPKTLTTPGVGGVPPAKPLRSYQCGKSPLGSLGGSARFSRDSSVSLYSIPDRLHGESGYMSSPERGGGVGSGSGRYPPGPYSAGSSYEDPYYSQYSGTVTPVIDEEASDTELLEESYSLYGVKPPGRPPSGPPRSPFPPGAPPPLPPGGQAYDATRIRVEHMERQLANLTGLVQKALTHAPHTSPSPREYLQVPPGRDPYARAAGAGDEFDKHSSSSSASLPVSQPAVTDDSYLRTDVKPPKLGKDKSVSFEKSVSFSDEPPDMNSPKQHSPQHAADTKPTKPAIKSSTLPRMSSQERDRHKPTPPPKPAALVAGQYVYRDLALTPEMYNQLRGLQKKAKDLRQEVRNLRRMSQAQAHTVRETIKDTFITIRAMLLSGGDAAWTAGDTEKIRLSREEDLYKQEMIRLENDLTELESTVEELRGNVINRKTRVNMSDVENMALILSKSSKTVADLKVRFPSLQEGMKGLLSSEMEKVVREEKFLKEEPERLESALRRCKKLTGTLVTLKRLASVQEQRLPNAASVDAEDTPPITPTTAQHSKAATPVPAERTVVGSASVLGGGGHPHESSADHQQRPENALDALLDELQTFSRPGSQMGHVSGGLSVHPGSNTLLADIGRASSLRESTSVATITGSGGRAPNISDIGRKGSVDSSSGTLAAPPTVGLMALPGMAPGGTLRRLHSYPSSSDTDTSPPIARLQALSLDQQMQQQSQPGMPVLPQSFLPGQKPPVPERNAELLQLASTRRVPPPPPPRTSSRSPLASPTSPQLPPRNHPCNLQSGNATLRRPSRNNSLVGKEGKPPMALPSNAILSTVDQVAGSTLAPTAPGVAPPHNSSSSQSSAVLSTSNSSSCESVNSQEGLQSKRGRQEQLEQRHQELLRKQKALQEQYARLQQLQRNAAGLTTVPPAPPDLLKKTGSESNLLAKMGLGLSAASSGSLTSLSIKPQLSQEAAVDGGNQIAKIEIINGQAIPTAAAATTNGQVPGTTSTTVVSGTTTTGSATIVTTTSTTTTSKVYETDIL